jgi:hypothetical protein
VRISLLVMMCAVAAFPAVAQTSPYAGMEARPTKALSPGEISRYLEGQGMGFAMAAELNSYPGPKHVLELADSLGLDAAQIEATQAIFERMHQKAVRLGATLVEGERELDALFAAGEADADLLSAIVGRLGETRGELRLAHLMAHVEMRAVLSAEQVAAYDELRGYRADARGAGERSWVHLQQ